VEELVVNASGLAASSGRGIPKGIVLKPSRAKRDTRLVTSFSDLRYYLECPHDFYLRKVLGFAPTIDQVFGYGRGVHNLLRAIHSDPASWAQLANEDGKLEDALNQLVGRGLMYLRYTVGEPQQRMEHRAVEIVADYVRTYADELATLHFEPEREFETLIEEEQVLVSGVIDIVRHDDPPRVSLVDFKSGEPDSDTSTKLDTDEMRLQVSLYGVAAKKELEYKPDQGVVRYLAEQDPARRELVVPSTMRHWHRPARSSRKPLGQSATDASTRGQPDDPGIPSSKAAAASATSCSSADTRPGRTIDLDSWPRMSLRDANVQQPDRHSEPVGGGYPCLTCRPASCSPRAAPR
jgi:DNA helicase-2/ATP-dependent DNA helicase PcrA